MLTAALVSLPVVFVAEFGDKSQLMTMTNALRRRWWVVLSGVGIASVLVHGLSVAIGHFLGLALPERPIAMGAVLHKRLPEHFLHGLASVLFLLFGLWLLFEGALGLRWVALGAHHSGGRCRTTAAAVVFVPQGPRAFAGAVGA
jgi:putative Ca2+/H+ antiporter (TMEM165/GDT1 family)